MVAGLAGLLGGLSSGGSTGRLGLLAVAAVGAIPRLYRHGAIGGPRKRKGIRYVGAAAAPEPVAEGLRAHAGAVGKSGLTLTGFIQVLGQQGGTQQHANDDTQVRIFLQGGICTPVEKNL
jgi:hypothetical protein